MDSTPNKPHRSLLESKSETSYSLPCCPPTQPNQPIYSRQEKAKDHAFLQPPAQKSKEATIKQGRREEGRGRRPCRWGRWSWGRRRGPPSAIPWPSAAYRHSAVGLRSSASPSSSPPPTGSPESLSPLPPPPDNPIRGRQSPPRRLESRVISGSWALDGADVRAMVGSVLGCHVFDKILIFF